MISNTEFRESIIYEIENEFPTLGKVQIYHQKNDPSIKYFKQSFFIDNLQLLPVIKKQIEQRQNIKHDFIIDFVNFSIYEKKNGFEIELFFECPELFLNFEILKRKRENQAFTQQEILNILESLLKSITYLEQCEMLHGNLCPEVICFSNGSWKLIDNFFKEKNFLEIQFHKIQKKENLYLAPELFQALIQRENFITKNFFVCEIFSIGMIILETGLQRKIDDIWDFENGEVNELILKHIQDFCKVFKQSELLKEMLILLLNTNAEKRRTPERMLQLYQMLKQKKSFSIELEHPDFEMKKVLTYELDENLKNLTDQENSIMLDNQDQRVSIHNQNFNQTLEEPQNSYVNEENDKIKEILSQRQNLPKTSLQKKILQKLISHDSIDKNKTNNCSFEINDIPQYNNLFSNKTEQKSSENNKQKTNSFKENSINSKNSKKSKKIRININDFKFDTINLKEIQNYNDSQPQSKDKKIEQIFIENDLLSDKKIPHQQENFVQNQNFYSQPKNQRQSFSKNNFSTKIELSKTYEKFKQKSQSPNIKQNQESFKVNKTVQKFYTPNRDIKTMFYNIENNPSPISKNINKINFEEQEFNDDNSYYEETLSIREIKYNSNYRHLTPLTKKITIKKVDRSKSRNSFMSTNNQETNIYDRIHQINSPIINKDILGKHQINIHSLKRSNSVYIREPKENTMIQQQDFITKNINQNKVPQQNMLYQFPVYQ